MSIMSHTIKDEKPFLEPQSNSNAELRNLVRKKQSVLDEVKNLAESCSNESSEDDFSSEKPKNFSCSICFKSFISKNNMIRHAKLKHPSGIDFGNKIKETKNLSCPICHKLFSSNFNKIRHAKSNHPYDIIDFGHKTKCKKFQCLECKKGFSTKYSLSQHALKFHPDKSHILTPVKKKSLSFKCDECENKFSHERNLNYHKRKAHMSNTVSFIYTYKCPKCMRDFGKAAIFDHFDRSHDIKIKTIELKFDSFERFSEWKSEIETDTKSKFIKYGNPGVCVKGITKFYFKCDRSGNYSPESAGIRPSRLKSKKMNSYCPASIKVNKSTEGVCTVFFQSTHVGHKIDAEYSFPTNDEKELTTEFSDNHESAAIDSDPDDSDTHDTEYDLALKELAQSCTQINSFEERRNNLLLTYTNLIKSLSCPEQLDLMERNIKFLITTLDAIKRSDASQSLCR